MKNIKIIIEIENASIPGGAVATFKGTIIFCSERISKKINWEAFTPNGDIHYSCFRLIDGKNAISIRKVSDFEDLVSQWKAKLYYSIEEVFHLIKNFAENFGKESGPAKKIFDVEVLDEHYQLVFSDFHYKSYFKKHLKNILIP